MAYKL